MRTFDLVQTVLGIQQNELAEAAGVGIRTLHRIENDERVEDYTVLKVLYGLEQLVQRRYEKAIAEGGSHARSAG